MEPQDPKPDTAKIAKTEYAGPSFSGNFARSVWAVGGLTVFLALVIAWALVRTPVSTAPAPIGAAGSGVVEQTKPTRLED